MPAKGKVRKNKKTYFVIKLVTDIW